MTRSPRPGRLAARAVLAAVLALAGQAPAAAAPPARVVSINLCTDQLALLVAAPGQVASVTTWSQRPAASNMAAAASRLPGNAATAEEVFLLEPDLVLASTFTARATVDMLRRLGLEVAEFAPATSVAEVFARIERMGHLLGREARAEEVATAFAARLDALARRAAALGPEAAAFHYPNNYTSGAETLASEVLARAGLANAAAEAGLSGSARLALERLVMLDPFLVRTETISGTDTGRAHESGRHPALAALAERGRGARIAQRWQVCGTPFLAEAIAALVAAREAPAGR